MPAPDDNIVQLDDYRPHVNVIDPRRKAVHVVPLAALEAYADGTLDAFEDPDLLRAIVGEWLKFIANEPVEV